MQGLMDLRRNLQTGDVLKLNHIVYREIWEGRKKQTSTAVVTEKWMVIVKYKHHVLCANKQGTRECFQYWYIWKHLRFPKRILTQAGNVTYTWR